MRKKQGSRVISIALALAITVSSAAFSIAAFAADSDTTVTIYHTNDIHGKVNSVYDKTGALIQIGMDVLKSAKDNTENSLLIDAGDSTQGVALASYSKGADIVKLMNAAGYDGATLGNHEFDYGSDVALSNAKLANYPVVSANTMDKAGQLLLKGVNTAKTRKAGDVYDENGGWFIKTVNNKKIGFFGITTAETAYKTNPNNLSGVTFQPEIAAAKAQVEALKAQKADAIIGIMHVGIDSSSKPTSHEIAQQVPGINVIIDGHSHSAETTTVNGTVIEQTGTGGTKLGRIRLGFAGGKVTATADLLTPNEVGARFQADASVTKLYNDMAEALAPTLNQKVGNTATGLYGGSYRGVSISRLGETNLGSLIADAMIYGGRELIEGKAQYENLPMVSLENGGGVRATIPAGDITVADVINVLPFGNALSLKEVTPKALYEALENGVENDVKDGVLSALGAFPQVGGMRFEFDISRAVGSRVTKIVLLEADGRDGKTLSRTDAATKLILVSNDFEVAGGDGYTMLKDLPYVAEGSSLDIVTANYIRELSEKNGGSFTCQLQGRIKMTNGAAAMPSYSANITVNRGNAALKNTEVSVSVDGGKAAVIRTDADGKLSVKLASGPHNIIVTGGGAAGDVFVSDTAKALLETEVRLTGAAESESGSAGSGTSSVTIKSDTTAVVNLAQGQKYTFKITVVNNDKTKYVKPKFSVGDGSLLRGRMVRKSGNDYYFQVTGMRAGQCGIYCTVNGTATRVGAVTVKAAKAA